MSDTHVRVSAPAGEVRLGRYAARVASGTPQQVIDELRRLLLAEHAMQARHLYAVLVTAR
jgi:hypothetical protein